MLDNAGENSYFTNCDEDMVVATGYGGNRTRALAY